MRDKDSYEEKYGRHSNFHAEPNADSSGPHLGKWLLVLFLVAFAVLGIDRWRKRPHSPPVTESIRPLQAKASPPPVGNTPEPLILEEAPDQTEPVAVVREIPAIPEKPEPKPSVDSAPPSLAAEKPETEARFEMKMNGANSFIGDGAINGKDVKLLADTGASTVVVPEKVALRLGLKKGLPLHFHTAGGDVPHFATVIDKLTLGRIEITNVPAAINPAMTMDFVLLGMSALKLMDMEYGDGKLVLKHKQDLVSKEMRTVDEDFKRSVSDCKGQGNKFDQQTLDCLRGR